MSLLIRKAREDDFYKTFVDMQREIDNVFSGFLGGNVATGKRCRMPSVDVYETEKDYSFEFELPGMKKDDIEVNVENDVLTVQSKVKEEKEEDREVEGRKYHVVERKMGTFKRQFMVPENASPEGIKAKFENGILVLTLPKKEEALPKSISVDIE
ncbi:MAG TPA: Hsp20/alpha crystallin family protein [Thermotogota bacterium]|nr:Hsp20/alpha crystallin family protein [Thermotogota bacterium]HRW93481.1 Hsp20/alpha crystallin family protein [Thermotogota bacterium]